MPMMYCPQCGRTLNLESGDVRFCRYCGFTLSDTKDALRGYSEQKRVGFSVVTWSYTLLLILTLLLHQSYIPLRTGWGYWISALLIVVSVSLFVSASVSALKPAMFAKRKNDGGKVANPTGELDGAGHPRPSLPASPGIPVSDLSEPERITPRVNRPGSVTEGTTRKLEN